MRIDVRGATLAAGIAAAVAWAICSALVALAPDFSMAVMATMVHMPASSGWTLTWGGFLVGLLGWSLTAALLAWVGAALYNQVSRRSAA